MVLIIQMQEQVCFLLISGKKIKIVNHTKKINKKGIFPANHVQEDDVVRTSLDDVASQFANGDTIDDDNDKNTDAPQVRTTIQM